MDAPLPWDELLEACGSVVYVAGLDGTVTWVAGQASALGAVVGDLLPVFELDRPRLTLAREAEQLDLAFRVERPSGGLAWVVDRARRLDVDGEPRWVGTWCDRSEARLAEREAFSLARLQASAELAGSVAHEANNALAGVLNYAELARRLPGPDPRYGEPLDAISSEAGRIRALTEGLRSLPQRAGDGKPYPLDPQHLLRGLVAPLRRTLRERLVTLEVTAEAGLLPPRAVGLLLQAALRELIDNALAACAEVDARRLELGARVEEAGEQLQVVFSVADSGPGLSAETVARAREAFFSTREDAPGLGLTLVERWAGELAGSLTLGPNPGGGTLAELTVPVA
jgi:signal transduction histidine kinase